MFETTVRRFGNYILLGLSFLIVLILYYFDPTFIQELENRTWDWRAKRIAGMYPADSRIKIIEIDQDTLNFFESEYSLTWPFPREIYAHLIDFMKSGAAKGIAFDVLFTESSVQSPEGDLVFAKSLDLTLPTIMALVLEQGSKIVNENSYSLFKERQLSFTREKDINSRYSIVKQRNASNFTSVTLPVSELIQHSASIGYVHSIPDSDGVFRRHVPSSKLEDIPILSLPFALYEATREVDDNFDLKPFLDEEGKVIIRMQGKNDSYERFSFAAIIQSAAQIKNGVISDISPAVFKDAFIFVGTTAPGLLDFRPTSINERGDGVEFMAATLDNILNNGFIIKLSHRYSIMLTILVLILTWLVKFTSESFLKQLLFWLILLVIFVFGVEYAAWNLFWIPFVVPLTTFFLVSVLSIALQYFIEGKQHRFIRKAFQHYVSPALIQQIVSHPENLALGGRKCEVSIMFTDIVGFTSASEELDPSSLVQLLNEYLSLMTDVVQSLGGTLDKYIGDAIVAFWNAPVPLEDHASLAVKATIECQKQLMMRKEYFLHKYGFFPATRMGVHSAEVSVGNFGSKSRFDYTVIGDGVNLASRLEGVNKYFTTSILISETTMKACSSDLRFRKVGIIRVVGKKEAVSVYEPLAYLDSSKSSLDKMNIYQEAITAFENGKIDAAKSLFQSLPDDSLSRLYLERLSSMESFSLEDWDPVWNVTSK